MFLRAEHLFALKSLGVLGEVTSERISSFTEQLLEIIILYYFSKAEKRLKGLKLFLNISTEKAMVNLTAKTVWFFALEQNVYHV